MLMVFDFGMLVVVAAGKTDLLLRSSRCILTAMIVRSHYFFRIVIHKSRTSFLLAEIKAYNRYEHRSRLTVIEKSDKRLALNAKTSGSTGNCRFRQVSKGTNKESMAR